jgi:hypothetical protein
MSRPTFGAACALALAVSAPACAWPTAWLEVSVTQPNDGEVVTSDDTGAAVAEATPVLPPDAIAETAPASGDDATSSDGGALDDAPRADTSEPADGADAGASDSTLGDASDEDADATDATDATDAPDPTDAAPPPLPVLATDLCDEPDFAAAAYVSATRGPLTFSYLPGTLAETELDALSAARADAYDSARTFLGVASTPPLTVVLSPNRLAAKAHGYANGWADPSSDRAEVLYLPGDAFEHAQYGHELTHLLSAKVDGQTDHLKFLDEGLSELLDASGRDLHQSYVDDLRAGALLLNAIDGFDDWDVDGWNYGRSGSFVRLLVDTWGKDKFVELWKRSATTWAADGRTTTLGDLAESPAGVEKALDALLTATYGEGLAAVRLRWRAALIPHYALPPTKVADADAKSIADVIAVNDWALTHGDAAAFRSTMEGFYCDRTTDAERMKTANAMVQSRGVVRSRVVSMAPIGRKNYPRVVVFLTRDETRGAVTDSAATSYYLEHFPIGWRITVQPM